MPLARVYSYCKLLAFWLVCYGEQLTAFLAMACRHLVVGWYCYLVRSSKEEWNNSPPLPMLSLPLPPTFPHCAMGYASTLTIK